MEKIYVSYDLYMFLFFFHVYNADIACGFENRSRTNLTSLKTTSTMENPETTKGGIQDATGCSSMDQGL